MEELRARFSLEDDITAGLDSIADSIDELVSSLEDVESASEGAFDSLENASDVASSVDEMADAAESAGDSIDDMGNAASDAGSSTDELASASSSAGDAMNDLASSVENVSSASSELSASSQEAGAAASDMGSSLSEAGSAGASAFEAIASAIGAAAISASIGEIVQQAHQLTEAFSAAQKTITNATGASGAALSSMSESALEAWAGNDDPLQDVAGATGEINTRMGYTGQLLTDTTAKFLDYADVTGQNVVGSVRNVTQAMNQWGISQGEVGVLMDKLTYAGQVSGASVSDLTNTIVRGGAAFQNAGLDIDSAINMLADFELAGIQSSSAIMAMRTAVNKLSKEGVDVKSGILEAVQEIATMGNESQATAKAVELFGSRAGQQLGAAIRSGVVSVDTFNASLEKTRGTMEVTAKAGESLEEKWLKASNSLQAGIMQGLAPGIDQISSGMAEAATGVGDFLRENEGVTQLLAGMVAGFGAVTVAVTAFGAAMKVAAAASTFLSTIGLSLGPLLAIGAGIGLLTAGYLANASASKKAYEEEAQYTATTREHMAALEADRAAYQRLSESGQQNSQAAQDLWLEMQNEQQWLEANSQSMENFRASIDSVLESHDSLMESLSQEREEVSGNAKSHAALISHLEDYVGINGQSKVSAEDARATYDKLQETLGPLSTSFDDVATGSQSAMRQLKKTSAIKDFMTAYKQQADQRASLDADQVALDQKMADATIEKENAEKRLTAATDDHSKVLQQAYNTERRNLAIRDESNRSLIESAGAKTAEQEEYDAMIEKVQDLSEAQQDLVTQRAELNASLSKSMDAYSNDQSLLDTAYSYGAALSGLEQYKSELESLAATYDEVYNAAKQAFDGQFGLFDNAQVDSNATAQNLLSSLESQAQYWNDYGNNVETVTGKVSELSQATGQDYSYLLDFLESGTPEAAGLAADFAQQIEQGNTELLQKTAETYQRVEEGKQKAATAIAESETDIQSKLDEVKGKAEEFVSNMDGLSEEYRAAGQKLIDSFFEGLNGTDGDMSSKLGEGMENLETGGGQIEMPVTADTSQAESEIANAKDGASNPPAEMPVTANDSQVAEVANDAKSTIESTEAEMPVTANDSQVAGVADDAKAQIEGTEAEMPVTADASQVAGEVESATSGAGGREVKIAVTADTSQVESSLQSITSSVSAMQAKVTVTADISQAQNQLNQIQSLAQSIHPEIKITESGADQVISQINAIGSAAAAINPVTITVTDNGTAAAIAASINSIPTSKTVTVSVNEVSNKSGHWQGTVSSESSFYAGEQGPELVVKPIAQYAYGTTDSDSMFIAGENGPELITGAPGSTVFPASETNRIIEALSEQKPLQIFPNADGGVSSPQSNNQGNSTEKRFVIEINGSGSISAGNSGMDKQQVLDILVENAKPVLMNIIENEIYEEGDLSYDY